MNFTTVGQSFEKDSQAQSLKDEYQLDMEKTVEPLLARKEAKASIKAAKEGTQMPQHPSYNEILMMASSILGGKNGNSNN